MKKNFFLNFCLKYRLFYKFYLFYNLYIRNLRYLLKDSYSQFNEDTFLMKFFDKKKGFFIDIGCHHPFRYNNTYKLYKLGWRGINIDLSQISIDLFNFFRPEDTNICTLISMKPGSVKYYIPNGNLLSPEITTDIKFCRKYEKKHGNIYKEFHANGSTWNEINKQYDHKFKKKVDLLKIDIEGSDLNILKTIEIEKLKPKLIMTEAPDADKLEKDGIINYLNLKNYNVIFDNKLNIIFERN